MSAGDNDLVKRAAGQRALQERDRLRERAAEQRAMVRWWAAECRQRNAACRRRFSAANVAAATEARAILRDYVRAWAQTRELMKESIATVADRYMGATQQRPTALLKLGSDPNFTTGASCSMCPASARPPADAP